MRDNNVLHDAGADASTDNLDVGGHGADRGGGGGHGYRRHLRGKTRMAGLLRQHDCGVRGDRLELAEGNHAKVG